MPGILEDIASRLIRLEEALSESQAAAHPTLPSDSVWGDGAMSLSEAQAFAHVGRDELWRLMNAGEMPWAVLTRARVVPRRWLVQYLERKQLEAASGVER